MANLFDGKTPQYQQQQQQQQQQNPDFQSALNSLRQNPAAVLQSAGYSVPANLAQDPGTIIQYLLSSGQVPPQRLTLAQNALRNVTRRL